MRYRLALLLAPALLLAACAPPAAVVEEPTPRPAPETEAYPAYETFDPAAYPVTLPAPPEEPTLEHDVPPELMAGTIVEVEGPLVGRTVEGFRIQLFTSESKAAADAVRDDVVAWFRGSQHEDEVRDAFEFGLHPVVVFGRPYYRVRVGIFLERAEAQPALQLLRERFPEAFVVPDTITVERN